MAEIVAVGNGEFRIVDGTRSRVAYAAGRAESRWVWLDGRVYVVDVSGSAEGLPRMAGGEDRTALAAPMPATVVAINVEPGQRVTRGDVMIVLEAMKMELPVKAPRDGTIRRIACRPGELVQPGVPLLELA